MTRPKYLFAVIILLFSYQVSSAEVLECQSHNLEITNDNGETIDYKTHLKISYRRQNLAVYRYHGTESVNFLLNNTVISFSASRDEVIGSFDAAVTGVGEIVENVYDKTLTDCDIFLVKYPNQSIEASKQLLKEITERASFCIRSKLCKKLGTILFDDFNKASEYPYEFGPLAVDGETRENEIPTEKTMNVTDSKFEGDTMQDTINTLADLSLSLLAKRIRLANEGRVEVSNVSTTFFILGSVDLVAVNGYFQNITLVKRRGDIIVTQDGLKIYVECTFGLDEGYIDYEKYEINYGWFGKYEGKLNTTIKNIDLTSKIELNFENKSCKAELLDLKVTKLDDIQISLTGLGSSEALMTTIISWSTAFFKQDLTETMEVKFKKFIVNKLSNYTCTRLRAINSTV